MKKRFLITVFIVSLVSCAGNPYFMEPVLFRSHIIHSIKQSDETRTIDLNMAEKFSIMHRKFDHHKYSRQGVLAALTSFANFDNNRTPLTTDQLAKLDYLLLTAWHSNQVNFRIEYDSELDCAKNLLKISGQDYELENHFPHKLLRQMKLQYEVTIRLVAAKSFYNVHLIDPERNDLMFYRTLDCRTPPTEAWYSNFIEIIVHEMAHLEQVWVHSGYQKAVSLHDEEVMDVDHYKLLGELIASKIGQCSHIVNEAFHWIRLPATTEQESLPDKVHQRLTDSSALNLPVAYSSLGWILANRWIRSYADDGGYIRRTDTAQYKKIVNACQTILSDDGIQQAGMQLMNDLSIFSNTSR